MAITICTVTGNVKNVLGNNVSGCTVKAYLTSPILHTGSLISGEQTTVTTDASGNFSLPVIETATVGGKMNFQFSYYDGTSGRKLKQFAVVVPNQSDALLSDLIGIQVADAQASVPASYVTVATIAGLAATDAQAAFAEHQSDIDAINVDIAAQTAGTIIIGDASNVATERTLSGDVTVSNTGVTAITSGVIVDGDISGSAAVSRSKIASGTANGVVINDASGLLSSVAPSTVGNVLASDGTKWVSTPNPSGGAIAAKDEGVSLTTALASIDFVGAGVTATVGIANDVTVTIPGDLTTASNVGTAGVGVFKQKTSDDLEFKKIKAASTKVTVTDNTGASQVDLDVTESALTLSNLGGTLSAAKGGTGADLSASTGVVKVAAGTVTAATVVDADVSATAAIARSKVASGTNNHVVINSGTGTLSSEAQLAASRGGTGVNLSASTGLVKVATGTVTAATLVDADVSSTAAIARTKVASGTINHVIINDGSGVLSSESALAVSRGGTGLGTLTTGNVILGAGTSTPTFVAPSTSGNVLTSNGSTWTSAAPVAGASPSNTIHLVTGNGHGSTDTKIRRFSTVKTNTGSTAMTLTQSSVNGDYVTINEAGLYNIIFNDSFAGNGIFGMSVNSTQLTTTLLSINAANILSLGMTALNSVPQTVVWTGRLAVNDVVRPHTEGGPFQTTAEYARFIITKLGS